MRTGAIGAFLIAADAALSPSADDEAGALAAGGLAAEGFFVGRCRQRRDLRRRGEAWRVGERV